MTVCILGAGAFGTALAIALSETNDIRLWGRNAAEMAKVEATRKNSKLPGPVLGARIKITSDAQAAIQDADFILSAVPLQSTHTTLKSFVGYFEGRPLIGCSKGVDLTTGQGGYSILKASYPSGPIGLLTGPSFAADIARGLPTALTLASEDGRAVSAWQAQLSNDTLRLYVSHDPIGAELGAALKNVIAIAAGFCDGFGYGDNTKSALITRGINELSKLGACFGANVETFFGLAGIGDLIVTCSSIHSRNRKLGEMIGRGGDLKSVLGMSHMVAEGVKTAYSIKKITQKFEIEMPICEAVFKVLYENSDPEKEVELLMTRNLKSE